MERLIGSVQHYPWGDPMTIPQLLGRDPDGQPWAEWWIGTHPHGPAFLATNGRPLAEIAGTLPYLVKLLAAARPLSLQTHPSASQAQEGFAREEAAGLAVDAAERIYVDQSSKAELLCALTPFDALCGFRPVPDTIELLQDIGAEQLAGALLAGGIAAGLAAVYSGDVPLAPIVAACAAAPGREAALVAQLAAAYPADASVAVTLLMNRLTVPPGGALFLQPGVLHAYLRGTAVEVMSASDNVVRGGLTHKHVDVDELLRIVSTDELAHPIVAPQPEGPDAWRYPTADAPFVVTRLDIGDRGTHTAASREIVLALTGTHSGYAAYLAPGETITVDEPANVFCVAER